MPCGCVGRILWTIFSWMMSSLSSIVCSHGWVSTSSVGRSLPCPVYKSIRVIPISDGGGSVSQRPSRPSPTPSRPESRRCDNDYFHLSRGSARIVHRQLRPRQQSGEYQLLQRTNWGRLRDPSVPPFSRSSGRVQCERRRVHVYTHSRHERDFSQSGYKSRTTSIYTSFHP